MRKMVVEVPDDVFRKLKLHAAEHDRTLKALVEDALRQYLGLKGGDKK
jgi:plasmid stability protein